MKHTILSLIEFAYNELVDVFVSQQSNKINQIIYKSSEWNNSYNLLSPPPDPSPPPLFPSTPNSFLRLKGQQIVLIL